MRVALVLGGGACVWDDLKAALALGEYEGVVTCNDVTAAYPGKIDACASLHASSWPMWLARRAKNGYLPPERVYGHLEGAQSPKPEIITEYTELRFPGQVKSGSSGLFAAKVALENLGFDRAVLCGVPMSADQRHFFDPKEWTGALAHQHGWREALPQIEHRLRSMSGWTAELLGRPDFEWVAGELALAG